MRLFSEKVNPTLTNSSLNILQVENFQEIFFGVYEIEINKNKYPVEKISEHNGNPVVSVPVEVKGGKANYPFVLTKGKFEIVFNESSDYVELLENAPVAEEQKPEIINVEVIEEKFDVEAILEKKQEILEEIQKAKKNALISAKKEIEKDKKEKLRRIREQSEKKENALKEYLQTTRQSFVEEFVSISNKIKTELLGENNSRFSEINETIDNKIQDLADSLSTNLKKDFNNYSLDFDTSIKSLIKDLHENYVEKKLDKELTNISKDIVVKVDQIRSDLDSKLKDKAEKTIVETLKTEVSAVRDSNIELNNSLNKNINKALSRVGNVDKKVDELTISISEEIENKIISTEENIRNYFDDKIKLLEEKSFGINVKAKKYFEKLIEESKNSLIKQIRELKKDSPIEYVMEAKKENKELTLESIQKDFNNQITKKIDDEVVRLRKYIAAYSGGGGGTVAQQFANGGTMYGNLTIEGSISAGSYLGITEFLNGVYLPLSGGTITGNLAISGAITSVDSIQIDTSAATTAGVGKLIWDDTDGTLSLGLKGGVVSSQLGQGLITRVVNKTVPSIDLVASNYSVVVVAGAQGQRLAIKLAQANNDANSAGTLGIVAENIAKNQEGFIITVGLLKNINTTGSLQGETWSDGDILYLSPFTAGAITNIKPQAPNHTVIVGYVEYSHSNNGKIYIKIDNGYELDELHNVKINGVTNGQVLTYNSSLSVWENKNPTNTGNFLSLSGGTITGNLSVTGTIHTTLLEAVSANISIIDIKQYELSGFNVTGNATVQGSISASNTIYSGIYNSNEWSSTYNTVQAFSGSWGNVDITEKVDALYSYLVQNLENNKIVQGTNIADFVANYWTPTYSVGAVITLSGANVSYLLGNSDGSSPSDWYTINLKPNFLFYRAGLSDGSTLDSFPLSSAKSAKYIIQVEDISTQDIFYGEINVVSNGTVAVASEYGLNHTTVFPFVEFGANIVSNRVILYANELDSHLMTNFIFKGNRVNLFS